jgi:hypothetical protein
MYPFAILDSIAPEGIVIHVETGTLQIWNKARDKALAVHAEDTFSPIFEALETYKPAIDEQESWSD